MADDTRGGEDTGRENRERTPGQVLVEDVEKKAEAYKVKIVGAVGPLASMVDVVAFYGASCDLITGGWVELHRNVLALKDPVAIERLNILRVLCTREMERCLAVLTSSDPAKTAGLK
jgi:hypothetical protein